MSKRFVLLALLFAVLGGAAVLLFLWYVRSNPSDQVTEKDVLRARRRLHDSGPPAPAAPAPVAASQTIRLAIGALGLPEDDPNRQLADLVTAEMSGVPALELVERQSLDKVLAELQMSLSGLVRAKDAIAVGKLLRADWFLLGTGTSVAGTNSIVVRVVDARTGILRDAGVFVSSQAPTGLASNLASFIRQCRKNASSGQQPVYLAIGTFQDLSINSRQAGFPSQLRGYLTAAFRGGSVTLLEREYVETLLHEVYLDVAGLTEGGPDVPVPMQSAYWMVNGSYQSYETAKLEVEVNLEVHRIFGTTKRMSLRDQPGEDVNQQIKRAIDQVMNSAAASMIPTRQTEVRAQMASGKELAGLNSTLGENTRLVYLSDMFNLVLDEDRAARKQRNAEEALRAFQTVLLLEPTNVEAKLYAAACLRNGTVHRIEEARSYYRQVIEGPVPDKWAEVAKQALSVSFDWRAQQAKADWFSAAAGSTTSSNAAEFYHREAETAKAELVLKSHTPEAQALAGAQLWSSVTNAMLGSVSGPMGVEDFVKTFGTNRVVAAQGLTEWYSKIKPQEAQLAPYLLAAVVTGQVDTNAPVVAELQLLLEDLIRNPEGVFEPNTFWRHVPSRICEWSWAHKAYRLAATLLEANAAASTIYTKAESRKKHASPITMDDADRMRLAFAYLGTQEWEKALRLFEGFSDQPFSIFEDGPWGDGRTMIFPGREIEYCRKKLGLPIALKPELQIGKPVLQLCRDSIFTCDDQGLWVAREGQLLQLGFDLNTNLAINLPAETAAPIAAVCVTTSNIWIGTDGGGLHIFDKASRQFRHLGQKDGLLMDKIASLYLSRDALWVGYGRKVLEAEVKSEGGLGRVDLQTGRITSFTPSALHNPGSDVDQRMLVPAGKAVRYSVLAMTEGARGELWFLAEGPTVLLCRYRSGADAWDIAVNQACSSLVRDPECLYVGQYWNYSGENRTNQCLGVSILDLSAKNAAWRELKRSEGLPPGRVTALALDGGRLWVGGFGYIALMDPAKDELCAVAYVQAKSVDRLQTGGGFLWAQFRCNLYRVSLANLGSAQGSN